MDNRNPEGEMLMTAYLNIALFAVAYARTLKVPFRGVGTVSFPEADRLYCLPNGRLVAYGPRGKQGEARFPSQTNAIDAARKAVAAFPQFANAAARLTFLGRSKDGHADLYVSNNRIAIARHSDDPSDYSAMPTWIAITLPDDTPTREAADRASGLLQCGAA